MELIESLKISREKMSLFYVTLLIIVIARWQALMEYTYSVDDYVEISEGISRSQFLGQGRPGAYLLDATFRMIGYSPIRAPVLTVGLSCVISAWVSTKILGTWRSDVTLALALPLAVMIAAHPYSSELFTFRAVTVIHYAAYGLAIASALLVKPVWHRVAIASLLLALSISIYQVALNFLLVFIILKIVFDVQLRLENDHKQRLLRYLVRMVFPYGLVVIIGLIFYFLICKLTMDNLWTDNRTQTGSRPPSLKLR